MLAAALVLASSSRSQLGNDAYAIKTVLRLAPPYDVKAMNDEFQTAKLIEEKDGVGTFEIVLRPLHRQEIVPNPNWRKDDAGMTEFLKPRPAANWDAEMRTRVLAELHAAGIDPEKLDDKTCVEKVARWAMQRSTSNDQFGLWMVRFDGGKPDVPPELKEAFERYEPKGKSMAENLDRELFGKAMFENKTHGACTSTSTYLTTILRAIGIPTRIILTVPAADSNDTKQIEMLVKAVRHNKTRKAILRGMPASEDQFTNHVYNEVWIGKKWVRLNYTRLGQPIVDPNYLGLMVHVYTANDFSEVPFAETWGKRYGTGAGPKLSSINPYQLISVEDEVKEGAPFDNPPNPELTNQTVTSVVLKGSPLGPGLDFPSSADAMFLVREWLADDDYHQLRDFIRNAKRTIILRAPGQPDVNAKFSGSMISSGNGQTQGYGFKLDGKLSPGVAYEIVVDNAGYDHTWTIAPGVKWQANP